jgi:hypothetical protein
MFAFLGKRKKEKELKEKRKGRRGNYTFLLALSIMAMFILLYFLLPASLVPSRTPTPTLAPTRTPPSPQPIGPNASETPLAVPPFQTLQLQALCSPGQYTSSWQVTNPNAYPVTFTYIAQSLGTSASATLTVPATSGSVPGVLKYQSYLERGGVLMRIFVSDSLQAILPANADPCPTTPTPSQPPIPTYTRTPS